MEHKLHNPIIPGFYPDPSICRVGEDFYLVCSSFELCPGIPLFHSRDLQHWEQLCYVMTPENGFHVEKNTGNGGVMAPTIRYHDGTFYLINCNFGDRGNFIVTAKDPAGPWSEPRWLDDVPGIDASIFFDADGACYIMGTAQNWPNETGGLRQGIWAAKYDIENFRLASEPVALWGGAMAGVASPESPHIYHIGKYYYLLIAEGGTEQYHSATVARSESVFGPYEGCKANPVLTMRHMGQKAVIQNAGHADLVDLPDGSWYAVFLASRLIGGESKNLGRETFLVPVRWELDWPLFTPDTGKVEWDYAFPTNLPWSPLPPKPVRDDFRAGLGLDWSFWGRPYERFWETGEDGLSLRCLKQALADPLCPEGAGERRHRGVPGHEPSDPLPAGAERRADGAAAAALHRGLRAAALSPGLFLCHQPAAACREALDRGGDPAGDGAEGERIQLPLRYGGGTAEGAGPGRRRRHQPGKGGLHGR